jgi:hypothetical protein
MSVIAMKAQDFRIGLRLLLKDPAYSLVAVLGLAVGLAVFLLLLGFARYCWQYNSQVPDADDVYIVKQRNNLELGTPWYDQAPLLLLVAKALEQRALMSWGARWPVIVCALLPPVGLLALSVGTVSALVAIAALGQHWNRDPASWGLGVWPWAHQGTLLIAWLALYGFPVLCTFLLVRYTVTRRLGLAWPLVGVLLTSALGAWTTFTVAWPQAGAQGRLSAGMGLSTDWDNLMRFGARWATTVILALGLYLYMRRREHEVWQALGKHRM